jgi:hypothetical protein
MQNNHGTVKRIAKAQNANHWRKDTISFGHNFVTVSGSGSVTTMIGRNMTLDLILARAMLC